MSYVQKKIIIYDSLRRQNSHRSGVNLAAQFVHDLLAQVSVHSSQINLISISLVQGDLPATHYKKELGVYI
jgi:hypothetical protein